MNIIVCIKQVPGTTNVKVDPVTGVLIRDGVQAKMNPYDLYALEAGLQLKEKTAGKVTVISMGPPAALAVLKEAIYMGADEGILISDRKFGGADVLATAYTISQAIRTIDKVDLVLTGKQTTDGDTGQVGAETAEFLNIPHFGYVTRIKVKEGQLEFVSNLDNSIMKANITLPCLLCMDGEINTPRLPSYRRKVKYRDCEKQIRIISFSDMKDQNESKYGLKGSATQVEKIFQPEKKTERLVLEGTREQLAKDLFKVLKERKFI
ncbi:MAG TPA: electron transfer flavoprotein subunit beta/FixA family protein [Erysipelotrichaceae bacterium]|nr:electron transfer flavoprotein subunit beta/FixA family protein [Erysipelotrichaceae bacterium]HQB32092.1 electron transfer flavoprotein subunit beta/FixA family protein [Erysipelotrichaceae bacterium]